MRSLISIAILLTGQAFAQTTVPITIDVPVFDDTAIEARLDAIESRLDAIEAQGEDEAMAFPTGWQRKCSIDIDNTEVGSSDLTDFTVLLTRDNLPDEMCSPTDSNRAQSDGGDIRFSSDSSGTTQLALHVEEFEYDTSDAAGDAVIALNVKVSVNGTGTGSDTTIYVWYSTTGTDSQPANTDTYGARNAYDSDHCHVVPFNEGASGGSYTDVLSDREFSIVGTGADDTDNNGLPAFDSNAKAAYVLGEYSGHITPDGVSTNPFTNTGLAYVPGEDTLILFNFDDEEVVEINKNTGAETDSWAPTQGEGTTQGILYDSTADQVGIAEGSGTNFYDRDGTYDRRVTHSGGDAICYDADTDCIWSIDGSYNLIRINKTTGSTEETVTVSDTTTTNGADGITYSSSRDSIFVSHDASNVNLIYEIDLSDGSTANTFRGPVDIEHLAYDEDDDILWVNSDARFHNGSNGGENVVFALDPDDGSSAWWKSPTADCTHEWWGKPTTSGTTLWYHYSPLNGGVDVGGHIVQLQHRSGGALRWGTPDPSTLSTGTAAGGSWHHVVERYDHSGADFDGILNNTGTASGTTTNPYGLASDQQIKFGAWNDGQYPHDGSYSNYRLHRVARSDDWINARYNNSNDPASFATAGTPEDSGTAISGSAYYYHQLLSVVRN